MEPLRALTGETRGHGTASYVIDPRLRGLVAYRRFVSDAQRLAEKSRRAEKERQTGAVGTLVKDPATGEYRLKREED